MARQNNNKLVMYNEYLANLNKADLITILEMFHIEYKKSANKNSLEVLIIENIDQIVENTMDMFQADEFYNIKLFVKKKGKLTIRVNHLLLHFLKNLVKHKLAFTNDNKTFYLPKELYESYKSKLKGKKASEKVKENSDEYNLILGFIDAYGVIEYNKFYDSYSKIYKVPKDDTLKRIKDLSKFYGEFNIFEDKKKVYIASNIINSLKECKELLKNKGDYAVYTNEELMSIHDFSYMTSYKSYKKLMKFINRNYYLEKGSFKIVNKYVLIPFLTNYQLNKEVAKEILSSLIDVYFEFNNKKHKEKFMELIEDLTLDYPSWNLKGYSERN